MQAKQESARENKKAPKTDQEGFVETFVQLTSTYGKQLYLTMQRAVTK